MKMVGFAGHSLAEMQELFRGIELFYFCQAQAHGEPVNVAQLWFAPDDLAELRAMNARSSAGLDADSVWLMHHVCRRTAVHPTVSGPCQRLRVTRRPRQSTEGL